MGGEDPKPPNVFPNLSPSFLVLHRLWREESLAGVSRLAQVQIQHLVPGRVLYASATGCPPARPRQREEHAFQFRTHFDVSLSLTRQPRLRI